jgi:hypothetical protein
MQATRRNSLRKLRKREILKAITCKGNKVTFKKPILLYGSLVFNLEPEFLDSLSLKAKRKTKLIVYLLQSGQPVAYISKVLTETQQRYPQIENEATAIRYGCQRLHEMVYGKRLTIETDHKPLETIFKNLHHHDCSV